MSFSDGSLSLSAHENLSCKCSTFLWPNFKIKWRRYIPFTLSQKCAVLAEHLSGSGWLPYQDDNTVSDHASWVVLCCFKGVVTDEAAFSFFFFFCFFPVLGCHEAFNSRPVVQLIRFLTKTKRLGFMRKRCHPRPKWRRAVAGPIFHKTASNHKLCPQEATLLYVSKNRCDALTRDQMNPKQFVKSSFTKILLTGPSNET